MSNAVIAIIVVAVLVIGSMASAFWWISSMNERQAMNIEWRNTIDNAYLDCGYGTSFENEACMKKVDFAFNKFCKDFDSC